MTDFEDTLFVPLDDDGSEPVQSAPGPGEIENTAGRYVENDLIGAGGIGSVMNCLDPNLGREVALKQLHGHLSGDDDQKNRFVREARVMAQIAHPNIVPVHELGLREDGSVYFTMKHVRGVTLEDVLAGLEVGEARYTDNYGLPRLLDIFVQICHAVAFAHSKSVIHRDLKPANILIGSFGEVLVLDWGMAKVLTEPDAPVPKGGAIRTAPTDSATLTLEGSLSGTPFYMSPEQASGSISLQDGRTDIYSLGAILYEMLTLEFTVEGDELKEVLERVQHGEIIPPRVRAPERNIPRELDAVCMRALQKKPEDRYRTTRALIADIEAFRQGRSVSVYQDPAHVRAWKWCKRHPVRSSTAAAVLLVTVVFVAIGYARAHARHVTAQTFLAHAKEDRERGSALYDVQRNELEELARIERTEPLKTKSPREAELERNVARRAVTLANHYDTALTLYNRGRSEGYDAERMKGMIEIYSNRIRLQLLSGKLREAETVLDLLDERIRSKTVRLDPREKKGAQDALAGLREELRGAGRGRIDLQTEPPGARFVLYPMEETATVGTPAGAPITAPGTTPATVGITPFRAEFDVGSYLLTLEIEGRPIVLNPVYIEHGVPAATTVFIPRAVPKDTVYVPGGDFCAGGAAARHHRIHRKSLPGFFIAIREVTFGDYLRYWKTVGDPKLKETDRSYIRASREERCFHPAWDDAGTLTDRSFRSKADGPPFRLRLDAPVVGIHRESAERYCAWLTARRGRTCRLPTADEWEKAARGVDGRDYVWGDGYTPGLAFVNDSEARDAVQWAFAKFGPWAPGGSFPNDRSVYGALDMGGNVREWTSTRFPRSELVVVKGASASVSRRFLYCCYASDTPVVPTDIGFRYVIELDEER